MSVIGRRMTVMQILADWSPDRIARPIAVGVALAIGLSPIADQSAAAQAERATSSAECVQAAGEVSNSATREAALDRLAGCESAAVRALARELRRAGAALDSADLPRLTRAFAERIDSAAFDVVLTLSADQAASPVTRILALLAALAQHDSRLGPRPGSTLRAVLADSTESRCHVSLVEPAAGRISRPPSAAGGFRLADVTEQIYRSPGDPSLRLFARCARLALVETVALTVPDSLLRLTYVCGDYFAIANDGREPAHLSWDQEGEDGRTALVVYPGEEARLAAERRRTVRLYQEDRLVAAVPHGDRRCEKGVVAGVVRDTAGNPIPGAGVLALGMRERARVDDRGAFSLAVEPGPELLMIRAIGFDLQRVAVSVLPADTLRVTAVLARRSAHQLPEIVVEGQYLPPKLAEFAKRMRASPAPRSRFIDPETMDTWARFDLGNVLRRAGLSVGNNAASCPRGGRMSGDNPGVAVYLDGARVNHGGSFDVDMFPVNWFLAAEVYIGAAEIPIEYLTPGVGCVLILWTH